MRRREMGGARQCLDECNERALVFVNADLQFRDHWRTVIAAREQLIDE